MSRLSFSQRIALFASAIAPTARRGSAALAGFAAGAGALDGRDDARAAAIRALVLEQRVEVGALERVDERDDLVGLEVVVVVDRRVGAVAVRGAGLGGPGRGALRRRLGPPCARADRRRRRLRGLARAGAGGLRRLGRLG